MSLHKLIEKTDRGIVFISKCDTDSQLISLALRIFADVDKKIAEIQVNDLKENKKLWVRDRDEPELWWALQDTGAQLILHLTDAVDPYDKELLKVACQGSYAIGHSYDHTFKEAYDAFKEFMWGYYAFNSQAFYRRWCTKGKLVFEKPGDKKSKVKFKADDAGNINYANPAFGWAEADASAYDGIKMGHFWHDEPVCYRPAYHQWLLDLSNEFQQLREDMFSKIGISADREGSIKPFQCLAEQENGSKHRCKTQCGMCKGLYDGDYSG